MNIIFTILTVFRVAFVGDPQVDNLTELSYARESVYSELRSRTDLDLVIVLGDIVNEKTELIAPSEASLDSLGCPWVRIHGNHDGKDIADDTTFFVGGIRFVLLNHNVLPDSTYAGKTVICAHEPFKAAQLRQDNPDVLYATAHLHRIIRNLYPGGSENLVAGATCGTWWRGPKDENGIPYALMGCGAPRGYFIADFHPSRKQWYNLRYKCLGRPASDQARAWIRDGKLIVNVYGGSADGMLEARIGGKWTRLGHESRMDPEAEDIYNFNKTLSRTQRRTSNPEYMPVLRSASTHVWTLGLEDSGASEEELRASALRIRYSDRSMKFHSRVGIVREKE